VKIYQTAFWMMTVGLGACSASTNEAGDNADVTDQDVTEGSWLEACPARMRAFRGAAPPRGFTLKAIPNRDHGHIYEDGPGGVGATGSRRPTDPIWGAKVQSARERAVTSVRERHVGPVVDLPNAADGLPAVSAVVLHTTNGPSVESAYTTWATSGTSAHYIIDLDGTIWVAVPECHMAFHSPDEFSSNARFRNQYSIGIEHVGVPFGSSVGTDDRASLPGFLPDGATFKSTPAQLASSKLLAQDICTRYGLKCQPRVDLFRHFDLVADTQCPGQWPLAGYQLP